MDFKPQFSTPSTYKAPTISSSDFDLTRSETLDFETPIELPQPNFNAIPQAASTSSIAPVAGKSKVNNLEDMYNNWKKSQNSDDLTPMLEYLNSDIDKAIYAYAGLNAGPAVKSKAKLLAIKAIKNYDPKSKSSLRSWVYTQLQPISRYARDLSPSPMPERTLQQLSLLKYHENEFYENKGRAPSDQELADATGLSMKQIGKLRKMDKKTYSESFTAFKGENPVSAQELTVTEDSKIKDDTLAAMYDSLTPQEQFILEHKLGYNNNKILSNNEIAKKLKMSPGRVSQLTAALAAKLDEYAALAGGQPV
jgi:RNA polymerase sigma factor (sigma-70 family)